MFILVPAHPGCPGQNPESCKMVCVCVCVCVAFHISKKISFETIVTATNETEREFTTILLTTTHQCYVSYTCIYTVIKQTLTVQNSNNQVSPLVC